MSTPRSTERAKSANSQRRGHSPLIEVAEIVAFVGLLAAFIGAVGPAQEVRTTYAWPPENLPRGEPSRLWYTPLLLAARIPERVSISVPCTVAPVLEDSSKPVTALATARSPERAGGLVVTHDAGTLTVRVGDTVLARTNPTAATPGDACSYRLDLVSRSWSLQGGPTNTALSGELEQMPVVNGLFSELDLRSGPAPRAEVTTIAHGVRTLGRQALAWSIALICVLIALILVARAGSPNSTGARRTSTRQVVATVGAPDAFVGFALLSWWILAPVFFDDGWTIARQRAFETTGASRITTSRSE